MPRVKHIFHNDDKEYEIPLDQEFVMVCCDCCLVHRDVYTLRDGKLFWKTKRDNRSTGQIRRYQNVKIKEI